MPSPAPQTEAADPTGYRGLFCLSLTRSPLSEVEVLVRSVPLDGGTVLQEQFASEVPLGGDTATGVGTLLDAGPPRRARSALSLR